MLPDITIIVLTVVMMKRNLPGSIAVVVMIPALLLASFLVITPGLTPVE
jgi:hypothetical protein